MLASTFSHVAWGKKTRRTSMPYDSAVWASDSASVRFIEVSPFVGPTMKTALSGCGVGSAARTLVANDVVATSARAARTTAPNGTREARLWRNARTDNLNDPLSFVAGLGRPICWVWADLRRMLRVA